MIIASKQISKRKLNFLTRFSLNNAPSFPIIVHVPNYINYTTEKRLSTVALSVKAIDKIIQNLDSNKMVMITKAFACLGYVVTQSMNHLR